MAKVRWSRGLDYCKNQASIWAMSVGVVYVLHSLKCLFGSRAVDTCMETGPNMKAYFNMTLIDKCCREAKRSWYNVVNYEHTPQWQTSNIAWKYVIVMSLSLRKHNDESWILLLNEMYLHVMRIQILLARLKCVIFLKTSSKPQGYHKAYKTSALPSPQITCRKAHSICEIDIESG